MAVQIRLGPDIRLLLFILFSKIHFLYHAGISGLVVEYIVAIDVTRVRFPVDTYYELDIYVKFHPSETVT